MIFVQRSLEIKPCGYLWSGIPPKAILMSAGCTELTMHFTSQGTWESSSIPCLGSVEDLTSKGMRERASPAFVRQLIEPGNDYCQRSPEAVLALIHHPSWWFQDLLCWDNVSFPKGKASSHWYSCPAESRCSDVSNHF